jgi:hypothetical protein
MPDPHGWHHGLRIAPGFAEQSRADSAERRSVLSKLACKALNARIGIRRRRQDELGQCRIEGLGPPRPPLATPLRSSGPQIGRRGACTGRRPNAMCPEFGRRCPLPAGPGRRAHGAARTGHSTIASTSDDTGVQRPASQQAAEFARDSNRAWCTGQSSQARRHNRRPRAEVLVRGSPSERVTISRRRTRRSLPGARSSYPLHHQSQSQRK